MLWSIRQNLKRLSRLAEPRPAFQRALRKELVVPRPWFVAVLKPAFATVSIVTMLGAGTATYAYTSDDVVPDHPLYPIREQVERVEEAIAVTPAKKAAVKIKQLKKRVREMEIMAVKRKVIQQSHVQKFTTNFEQAVTTGEPLQNGERATFDDALSAVEQKQARVLERVKERIPDEQVRERLEAVIEEETRIVTERIEKLQEKRKLKFELQLKRKEAIEQRLPFKLEENDVRVLPTEDVEGTLGATGTRMPPKDPLGLPPKRIIKPITQDRFEALRIRLRGVIERGRLQILRRKDGGIELVATSSTPPGIKLILKDINARLANDPGLVAPIPVKPVLMKPLLDRPPEEPIAEPFPKPPILQQPSTVEPIENIRL
ncbi:hypothetical protein A3E39_03005 [Candidatus Uhrbacteria bacterium RIFCSPHIGHO2_12_FULL_60_25]|uniref:DUF5667 domain-containing protein n=1 Tax=Candidatus Uhrbacteria bacterium RIFCSPHIGHO2_12_FULL_60_25 TaxID=1802399 RepID=A0A1F7UIW1_9BACT|nr:MAG: hypothetical protein A3D73_00355 [Candidatus Uhrbacteria bacterium RIFCSPHIGHO2_02_FULL_60_44]OGL78199.1 MAG: hypothetical protein A3E39_03005 [Candidatus Uhrbacteria bacterium RIFCSPHIGHO2_12_FULL_60_25]